MLANEMQPQDRRDLSLRYLYKIKGNIGNSAYPAIVPQQYRTLFQNKQIMAPLNVRVQDMMDKYHLCKRYVKAQFSYSLLDITTPTWTLQPLDSNFDLATYPKNIT